jgi:hypothetical protein
MTSSHDRLIWAGGHNAVRAKVTRRSSRSWVVEMSHPARGCIASDTSVKKAWRKALGFMLEGIGSCH